MNKYDLSIGYIIINRKGKFLLLQKAVDGVWDFPKGHFNIGENDEQKVAAREFEEETGISSELLKPIPEFRHEHTFVNPAGVQRKIVLFLAKCDCNPKLSPEHTTYVWANLEKAKELMHFKEKQKALEEAVKFLR